MKLYLKGLIMQILIVEDEIVPANYLKKILELEHYTVMDIVNTGVDAVKIARNKKPDVILMDMMLKDHMSGAEAAKEIHYINPHIIIIFLTAYSDKEMIGFAVEAEAFAYLLKPYRDKEILATLELVKAKLSDNENGVPVVKKSHMVMLADNYVYDVKLQRLFLKDKEIHLGSKALQLIQLLCKNKNITLEIEIILQELWDKPKSGQTLRSLIHRIRTLTTPNLIQNTNKFGYRIGLK